jgi:hypothetical protein
LDVFANGLFKQNNFFAISQMMRWIFRDAVFQTESMAGQALCAVVRGVFEPEMFGMRTSLPSGKSRK